MNILYRFVFAMTVALLCLRCDEANGPLAQRSSNVLEHAAGIAEERSQSLDVDLVLDGTAQSPGGSLQNVAAQLDLLLPMIAARSGSLRVWLLRETIEATRPFVVETFTPSSALNLHVQQRSREQLLARARERILAATRAALALPTPGQSILFQTLARVGLTSSMATERWVVLVSDLRNEDAIAHLECSAIEEPLLVQRLDRDRLLTPGSLRLPVFCAFFDVDPVSGGRCPNTVAKHVALAQLWQHILTRAGARVIFCSGPFQPGGLS